MDSVSKAWIFVSHSTRDIDGVRRLRDEMERRGAEPLLFFLKAIEAEEELRTLLRREIDARTFFLLCDSEAARASRWVGEEHDYVKGLTGKRVETLDLAAPWEDQLATIDVLLEQATVSLSFVQADGHRVSPYASMLADRDFAVRVPSPVEGDPNRALAIDEDPRDAERRGYLIAFLSRAWLSRPPYRVDGEIEAFNRLESSRRLILLGLDDAIDALRPRLFRPVLPFYGEADATNQQRLLRALGLG